MAKYRTHPKNFISRFDSQEQIYAPDTKLIETLHRVLDTLPNNTALIIDHIVYELMQYEGYGQPSHYKQLRDPEILNVEEDMEIDRLQKEKAEK